MRNPDTVYVLKMEYVSKSTIFGLKMMVKSGLEKIERRTFAQNYKFSKDGSQHMQPSVFVD